MRDGGIIHRLAFRIDAKTLAIGDDLYSLPRFDAPGLPYHRKLYRLPGSEIAQTDGILNLTDIQYRSRR
ncbi:hypothetical protein LTSEALA_2914 [Salmonella enterica subsp. enterica serovar Alachua str. R6-377]|uniref:Uncharacterized protein n=1 Tax=Salmonella enterica subsp. enterica serovar Alachua str. R6-377 TaxID=913241 RepID=G5LQ54_SALET|nr:hypothetical protein LTSEALA_2914 [Salmonella enterica subsp. enterica serovar Alachua str. R6-377]